VVFKRALQQMLDQVYEAAQGDARTSPVFREGHFGGRSPEERTSVFPPSLERPTRESTDSTETTYSDRRSTEEYIRVGPAPESTFEELTSRPATRDRRENAPAGAPASGRRPAPLTRRSPVADVKRLEVRSALRSRSGLRTALVLSEIVGPPRAIRGLDEFGR
jgi:hypothetical protein